MTGALGGPRPGVLRRGALTITTRVAVFLSKRVRSEVKAVRLKADNHAALAICAGRAPRLVWLRLRSTNAPRKGLRGACVRLR